MAPIIRTIEYCIVDVPTESTIAFLNGQVDAEIFAASIGRVRAVDVFASVIGCAVSATIFLILIDFQISDFVRLFLTAATVLEQNNPPDRITPIFVMLVVASIAVTALTKQLHVRIAALALLVAAISFLTNYGRGWEPLLLLCTAVIAIIEVSVGDRFRPSVRLAFASALLVIALPWIGYPMQRQKSLAESARTADLKEVIKRYQLDGRLIAIDPFAAREFFRSAIPDDSIDLIISVYPLLSSPADVLPEKLMTALWVFDLYQFRRYPGLFEHVGLSHILEAEIAKTHNTRHRSVESLVFEKLPTKLLSFPLRLKRYAPMGGLAIPVAIDMATKKLY